MPKYQVAAFAGDSPTILGDRARKDDAVVFACKLADAGELPHGTTSVVVASPAGKVVWHMPEDHPALDPYLATGGDPDGRLEDADGAQGDAEDECPCTPDFPAGLAEDPSERLQLAKGEAKALKAWKGAGELGDPPATPNLDAMNAEYEANGQKPAKRVKAIAAANAAKPAPAPAPKAGTGETVLELRNAKHGELVAKALPDACRSRVEGQHLVVVNGEWSDVFDGLLAAQDGAGQFTTRLLVLAGLQVREAFPKVADPRNSLVARLVTELNQRRSDGQVTAWSVHSATDATPTFEVDGASYATARACAAAVGVPTKA